MQCLNRVLDVLETLAQHKSLGVTELAKILGLHVATTHNILVSLQLRNYLLNDAGQYSLGPALSALARPDNPLMDLPRLAQPHLDEITHLTGESAIVSVLSGTQVKMMATTASVDGLSCAVPNQIFPSSLMLTTGRVLVAQLTEKEWKKHIEAYTQLSAPFRRGSPETQEEWKRTFQEIRVTRQCLRISGKDSGSIAVGLRNESGTVIAALGANSVSRFGDADHRSRIVAMVVEAGRQVSRLLGYKQEIEKEIA